MKSALAVAALATAVRAYDNGVGRFPPLGWSSWCTDDITCGILDYCNEQEVKQIADTLVSTGMRELGYSLLLLE
jgi:alpha-galactosidase